jgi:hypothetical protein
LIILIFPFIFHLLHRAVPHVAIAMAGVAAAEHLK